MVSGRGKHASPVMPVKLVLAGAVDAHKLELMRRVASFHGGGGVSSYRMGGSLVHRAVWRDVREDREDWRISMHAMVGHPEYRAMEDLLWKDAAGLVMVVELEEVKFQSTWNELMRVAEGLARVGLSVMSIPVGLLYVDGGGGELMAPEEMDRSLGVPDGLVPRFVGWEEGLESVMESVLVRMREQGAG